MKIQKRLSIVAVAILAIVIVLADAMAVGGMDSGGMPPRQRKDGWEIRFKFPFSELRLVHPEWDLVQAFIAQENKKETLDVVEYYNSLFRAGGPLVARTYLQFTLKGNYGPYMIQKLKAQLENENLGDRVEFTQGGRPQYQMFAEKTHELSIEQSATLIKLLPKLNPQDDYIVFDGISCENYDHLNFTVCTGTYDGKFVEFSKETSVVVFKFFQKLGIPYGSFAKNVVCNIDPTRSQICYLHSFKVKR